ncbi:hypothetical protein BLA24_32710 [Streptomyces cinnamoneus]|uniref:Uncharacterized protein n=1 Tax=Streptomyces cinnamoneus TaxID=53446 RepID=A0A2G1XAC6_STRCJ|nr:hypothetical protein [Streptomyces cinnamoneus]PHQ48186.1 hypothetical protein BLA24_32710 [Streptomyces cinnamoneus]PPT15812.1 hypothetical protein CYQ11_25760 [Streptomyces cinnamoneus]
MPTSASIILFVFGGLMVLISLLGSGFAVREISFPRISPLIRSTAALLGAGLVATSIVFLVTQEKKEPAPGPPTAGPVPDPARTSPPPVSVSPTAPAPPATAPPRPAPTGPPDDGTPTQALLTHVPSGLRSGCRAVDRSRYGASVTAVVECRLTGGVTAVYAQFTDVSGMNTRLGEIMSRETFTHSGCGASTPLNGRQRFVVGNNRSEGTLICFQGDDGDPHLIWSDESLAIMTEAQSAPVSYGDLLDWWRKSAGPVPATPDEAAQNAGGTT